MIEWDFPREFHWDFHGWFGILMDLVASTSAAWIHPPMETGRLLEPRYHSCISSIWQRPPGASEYLKGLKATSCAQKLFVSFGSSWIFVETLSCRPFYSYLKKENSIGQSPVKVNNFNLKHNHLIQKLAPTRRSLTERRTLRVHAIRMGWMLLVKPSRHWESLNVHIETPWYFHISPLCFGMLDLEIAIWGYTMVQWYTPFSDTSHAIYKVNSWTWWCGYGSIRCHSTLDMIWVESKDAIRWWSHLGIENH